MKKLLSSLLLLCGFLFVSTASAYNEHWGCFQRQVDGQCIVTVKVDSKFNATDQRVIREVLANFSESPYLEAVAVNTGNADVSIIQGCLKGQSNCGFWTDTHTRKSYIAKGWSYETYCCDQHDGMRGVFCHELMHSIGGMGDGYPHAIKDSCFDGYSGYLGVEDFQYLEYYATVGPA